MVKFHKYVERELIRMKSFEVHIKKKLDQINKGISPQLPQPLRESQKSSTANTAKDKGHLTRIYNNKLYIDNVLKKKYIDGKVVDNNDC